MALRIAFVSLIVLLCCSFSYSGDFRRQAFVNDPCYFDEFKCSNNICINRVKFCNGINDCGDNSDEEGCRGSYTYPYRCSTNDGTPLFTCVNTNKCIPEIWKCDGRSDCTYGEDERGCDKSSMNTSTLLGAAKLRATNWLRNQKLNKTGTDRWGLQATKSSVAMFLADPLFSIPTFDMRTEIIYELSLRLLSKIVAKGLKDVSTSDLASYINAQLATCLNPRNFYQLDLVKELRSRVDAQNYTNPYQLLTLCNAGDKITEKDTENLIEEFWNARREFWTDTQAIIVMALACAGNQYGSSFNLSEIHQYTEILKEKQYRNGTVVDLQTTALVLQALFSAEPEDDEQNFDEESALAYILQEQKKDGSFGSMMNTYYVLPVLSHRSLLNLSSVQCAPKVKNEKMVLDNLVNQLGPKIRVKYSLWIGEQRDVEKTLKLRIAANTSFYEIMEIAQNIDTQYKFQYAVKNKKPYVNAVFGIQDDIESGNFWYPYFMNGTKASPLTISPADFIPEDNGHVVMWYHRGSWVE